MAKGLFGSAAVISAPAPTSKKPKAEKVALTGMERFSAIKAAIKSLEALAAVEEAGLKGQMLTHFIDKATESKKRPDNFKGVEGAAEGSCQLKGRSSASKLTDDEKVILGKHEIGFDRVVKTPEAFIINPAYTHDMAIHAKVEEALANVDLPEDFLMKQEEVSIDIATEESMDAVFKKTAEEMELLLPLVSTMSITPKIEGDFWAILDTIMSPEPETTEA
jgi:hypothetical protein